MTRMRWLRSRKRAGSYLALFALAFQLAVSFGHVHLEHVAPLSAGASALAGAPPSADRDAPSKPAGREDLADDCCPICTLIHLAGALVPAEMPSLPLPTVFGHLRLELAAEGLARIKRHAAVGGSGQSVCWSAADSRSRPRTTRRPRPAPVLPVTTVHCDRWPWSSQSRGTA